MYYNIKIIFIPVNSCTRPVIIFGPLADAVTDKLIIDFPNLFMRFLPEDILCTSAALEKDILSGKLVHYKRKGQIVECLSIPGLVKACEMVFF